MFFMATLAVLVTMGMTLVRALLGPTIYDRVLAVNTFGTATVLLIAVLGFDDLDLLIVVEKAEDFRPSDRVGVTQHLPSFGPR